MHTGQVMCLKNLQLKLPVNSRLYATKIIGQKKAFHGQRIPEPSCARRETVKIRNPCNI